MSIKKTFKVNDLIDLTNNILKSTVLDQKEKKGACLILDGILHETGNYSGYSYLFDWNALDRSEAEKIQYNRQYHKKGN